jgi:hypothetical protein
MRIFKINFNIKFFYGFYLSTWSSPSFQSANELTSRPFFFSLQQNNFLTSRLEKKFVFIPQRDFPSKHLKIKRRIFFPTSAPVLHA